ncbi:ComEC/Rec2 family competence protein, partial [Arcobacteraceae bacterium]|nr:ComEC/Rec2 family competence protein [Arcobacteraceae bacterium]
YLAINPLTHYFFPVTTLEQLYSPILSILFTIFYPLSLLLHFLNMGDILDTGLEFFLNLKIESYEVFTNIWFLIIYIGISFLSIIKKEAFLLLNILLLAYNIWLFHFIF